MSIIHLALGVLFVTVTLLSLLVRHVAHITTPGGRHSTASAPPPEVILRQHPPRVDDSPAVRSESADGATLHKGANAAVMELLQGQIRSGRQLGVQVYAYHRGRLVVAVVAGVYRPMDDSGAPGAPPRDGWQGVDGDTIFMTYSVAKGVTAAALLVLADEGWLDLEEPTAAVWPQLAGPGPAGSGLTVAEAVSHRVGLPGTPMPPQRFHRAFLKGGWRGMWEEGMRWAEEAQPRWAPGSRCQYHHLSWSFIVGGLVEHKTGRHIADVVQDLGRRIGMGGALHLGRLPQQLWRQTAVLEAAPAGVSCTARGRPVRWWRRRLLAPLEGLIFRRVGNSQLWREACFPSSNGFFTAHALARMYGALANRGSTAGGPASQGSVRLVGAGTVEALHGRLRDASRFLAREPGQQSESRVSCGFSPWWSARLHGPNAPRCFGHNGMNGCAAYADPDAGLSVAILKNVYDEQVVYEGPGDDVADLMACVRKAIVSADTIVKED